MNVNIVEASTNTFTRTYYKPNGLRVVIENSLRKAEVELDIS